MRTISLEPEVQRSIWIQWASSMHRAFRHLVGVLNHAKETASAFARGRPGVDAETVRRGIVVLGPATKTEFHTSTRHRSVKVLGL